MASKGERSGWPTTRRISRVDCCDREHPRGGLRHYLALTDVSRQVSDHSGGLITSPLGQKLIPPSRQSARVRTGEQSTPGLTSTGMHPMQVHAQVEPGKATHTPPIFISMRKVLYTSDSWMSQAILTCSFQPHRLLWPRVYCRILPTVHLDREMVATI